MFSPDRNSDQECKALSGLLSSFFNKIFQEVFLLSNLFSVRLHFSFWVFHSPGSTKYMILILYVGEKKKRKISLTATGILVFSLALHTLPAVFATGETAAQSSYIFYAPQCSTHTPRKNKAHEFKMPSGQCSVPLLRYSIAPFASSEYLKLNSSFCK